MWEFLSVWPLSTAVFLSGWPLSTAVFGFVGLHDVICNAVFRIILEWNTTAFRLTAKSWLQFCTNRGKGIDPASLFTEFLNYYCISGKVSGYFQIICPQAMALITVDHCWHVSNCQCRFVAATLHCNLWFSFGWLLTWTQFFWFYSRLVLLLHLSIAVDTLRKFPEASRCCTFFLVFRHFCHCVKLEIAFLIFAFEVDGIRNFCWLFAAVNWDFRNRAKIALGRGSVGQNIAVVSSLRLHSLFFFLLISVRSLYVWVLNICRNYGFCFQTRPFRQRFFGNVVGLECLSSFWSFSFWTFSFWSLNEISFWTSPLTPGDAFCEVSPFNCDANRVKQRRVCI